ncbi:MAG TPA: HDOD domain-containing protein, partial [Rhodocyclaceae bacterium]|nr:HDOD domain-containing protein [Rhodocyclaceae bacterium]
MAAITPHAGSGAVEYGTLILSRAVVLLHSYSSPLNPRAWPSAACADEALRLLATLREPEDDNVLLVEAVLASPWLSLQLLAIAPDNKNRGAPRQAVQAAIRRVGKDLFTAWALLAAVGTEDIATASKESFAQFCRHSRMAAHLAENLATITRLCNPDYAYLAGLWHNLGQLHLAVTQPRYAGPVVDVREIALAADELKQYGQSHTAIAAQMVSTNFPLPLLAEAIELHHAPMDFVGDLPGLPRVLRATIAALSGAETGIADAAKLLNVDSQQVVLAIKAARQATPPDIHATSAAIPPALVMVSAQGLVRATFAEIKEAACKEHLSLACRLLTGRSAPLVLQADEQNTLRLLPECSPRELMEFTAVSDARSLCVQALLKDEILFAMPIDSGSAPDWLMARLLGGGALECVPWRTPCMHGVAVFVHETTSARADSAIEQSLLRHIVNTALAAYERARDQRIEIKTASESARQAEQYAARRIAHEVSNPLSIIGNYLSIIERQQKGTPELAKQMALMHAEIGRAQRLMKKLGRPIPARESDANSGV